MNCLLFLLRNNGFASREVVCLCFEMQYEDEVNPPCPPPSLPAPRTRGHLLSKSLYIPSILTLRAGINESVLDRIEFHD